MDWTTLATVVVPVVSVVATATVAIWTKRIDGATKREDRQHERALNYEDRVWQAKSDALLRLISSCRSIKDKVSVAQQVDGVDEDYNGWRSRLVQALANFKRDLGGEEAVSAIVAYASEPVRAAVDDMLEQIEQLVQPNRMSLLIMRNLDTQLERLGRKPAGDGAEVMTTEERKAKRSDLHAKLANRLEILGSTTADIDLDGWNRKCDNIISVARLDLRGRY